ncbi:MAG: DNA gyrase/topoisomerase IV subunit A [Bacteroidota bacterium]
MTEKNDDNRVEEPERDDLVGEGEELKNVTHLTGMFENWFLDYASYVILERAVPHLDDGLKPVQRRLMHSMDDLEDGRYNKVANIIGHTMKYHPHGDASIGDALVQLGQKNLLIDTQGNWGNILTGDSSAAPRYIEARLSKFALDVVYNPKITEWKLSYDGRNREPVTLPVKFPLLLAQGVEGIAVGLASKILPHNFVELIDASVEILKGGAPQIFPDFPTGGMMDCSRYNDGLRGGKIRIRSKISQLDKKTLVITEIPFGQTTSSLMDSIVQANEKGKIKIRKIEDNTAENVEILVHLTPGVSPDQTIDALYKFTKCEDSVSPNSCVVSEDKPRFIGVSEMLKISTWRTVDLLKKELEITRDELLEQLFFCMLEKIFIEKKIYQTIETCTTWESVVSTIAKGLVPFRKQLIRDVTDKDIEKLTEIKIKRISKFDAKRANEHMAKLKENLEEVKNHLAHLVDYAINFFRQIKKKYGAGQERKTEIRLFENIEAMKVVVANQKLYVDREEGFAGFSLTKNEFVSDCSDIDDIIVFRDDGTFIVTKVTDKVYVGKKVMHIAVFWKNDTRTIYHFVYRDGMTGHVMVKRFNVTGITRDKEYDLTKGTKGSKVLYFSVNPNGESETIGVFLKPRPRLKHLRFDFDFASMAIKGRNSIGNILTRFTIHKIEQKAKGESTLGALDVYYDETVMRLNTEGKGALLGAFAEEEKILTIMQNGHYRITGFDPTTHFDDDMVIIEKFNPKRLVTAVYYDPEQAQYFVKRFVPELTDKKTCFISESDDSFLSYVTMDANPRVEVEYQKVKGKQPKPETFLLSEYPEVKSIKAKGKKLCLGEVKKIFILDSIPEKEKKIPIPEPVVKVKKENIVEIPKKKEKSIPEPEIKKSVKQKKSKEPEPDKKKKKGRPPRDSQMTLFD